MSKPDTSCTPREDYLFGALQGPALVAYEAHLDQCDHCQQEVALHQDWTHALQAATPDVESLQDDEWERLLAHIPFSETVEKTKRPEREQSQSEAHTTKAPKEPAWLAWLRPWLVPATVFAGVALVMLQFPATQKSLDGGQQPIATKQRTPPTPPRATPMPRRLQPAPRVTIAAKPRRRRPVQPKQTPKQSPQPARARPKALARAILKQAPRKVMPKVRTKDTGPAQITTLLATNNPKIQVIWIQQKNFPEQPFQPDKDAL